MVGLGRKRKFESSLSEVKTLIRNLDESLEFKNSLINLLEGLDDLEVIKQVGEETPFYPYLVTDYNIFNGNKLILALSLTLGGEVSLIELDDKLID